jgi:hypothetical protein
VPREIQSSLVSTACHRHAIGKSGCLSRMVAMNDDCQLGHDMDTLTVMNEDVEVEASTSNDARYQ